MLHGARIAVVVPAHNEARLIGRVLQGIPEFVDEVIVVDDASRDATGDIVRAAAQPRVRLIQHATNRGVGAAIATGYRVARQARADVVAVMAGDNQMHPDDLRLVVEPVALGSADYAKGDRLHHAQASAMPAARRVGSHILSWLTRHALRLDTLSDSQCGFTAIAARTIDALPIDSLWPSFGYPNDLLGLIVAGSMTLTEVAVRPVYDSETSELRARHAFGILWVIGRAAWRVRTRRQHNTRQPPTG